MKPAERYRDLKVYRAAFRLQQGVYGAPKRFPVERRYSLTDQLRRSSRSVGASIAEAWQKRRYEAHFVSKLSDADAELAETRHWLGIAEACGYLEAAPKHRLHEDCREIGKMLGVMIRDAARWCSNR